MYLTVIGRLAKLTIRRGRKRRKRPLAEDFLGTSQRSDIPILINDTTSTLGSCSSSASLGNLWAAAQSQVLQESSEAG